MDPRPPDSLSSQFAELLRVRRPRTRWLEWVALSLMVLAVVAALGGSRAFERIDTVFHDQLERRTARPVSADIVIVAIDDRSLADVGRWPWRRVVQAELLDRITAGRPRAVGLDLILTESDAGDSGGDAYLAAALQRNGRVVLPVVLLDRRGGGQLERVEPVPLLAAQAAALAHIHLEIDPDGIVRSTFLREGRGQQWWDQFGLAVLRAGGFAPPAPLPGQRRASAAPAGNAGLWERDHWLQIPFAGPGGSFATVSSVDVLRGDVPASAFAGKYVLIGATSAGLGDAYPTPRSAEGELMAGVEISANVMNALLTGQRLQRADTGQALAFSLLPVAIALLALVLLSPTASLVASAALMLLVPAAAWLLARHGGIQFGPTAALAGVLLAYPLWIWRRLRAATDYLLEEFARMETRRDLPRMRPHTGTADLLDRHIDALRGASEQLRNLHQFVRDTLGSLPDATLIADPEGRVLMSNHAAERYFGARVTLKGRSLAELLQHVQRTGTRQPVFEADRLGRDLQPWTAEARDAQERDLLVKFAPCFNTGGLITGWIASLVDITPIRAAERQRDVALRFISHDMRSPQSSILALLEIHRLAAGRTPMADETVDRIERHARRTLELAEEFVQLARAESSAYQLELIDLVDLLGEAVDEVWPQAMARHIRFTTERPRGAALCEADRGLLMRALVNLLGNAVKYGREHTTVDCAIREADGRWQLTIGDHGPGMTPEQQARLFTPFHRLAPQDRSRPGVGLGLVFVRTVVERHGGRIEVHSAPGQGTRFEISLPPAHE